MNYVSIRPAKLPSKLIVAYESVHYICCWIRLFDLYRHTLLIIHCHRHVHTTKILFTFLHTYKNDCSMCQSSDARNSDTYEYMRAGTGVRVVTKHA